MAGRRQKESAKNSPTTLHRRIEDHLRKYLTNGRVSVGDKLPPETALCEKLSVSRNTLRMALSALEREGLIVRKKSMGTVVVSTTPMEHFSIDFSSAETLRDYVHRTKFTDRTLARVNIPDAVQRPARVTSKEKWVRISGVRRELTGQKIVAGIDLYVNPEYAQDAESFDHSTTTEYLTEFLRRRHDVRVKRYDFRLTSIAMPARWSQRMELPAGTPVMSLIEVVRRNDGAVLEVFSMVFSPSVNIDFALIPDPS